MTNEVKHIAEASVGFAMFEWLFIQIFKDNMGLHPLIAWIIGGIFFLLYILIGIKFRRDFIDSMFDEF